MEQFDWDDLSAYGLDPQEADYQEWLLSEEGKAAMQEMPEVGGKNEQDD